MPEVQHRPVVLGTRTTACAALASSTRSRAPRRVAFVGAGYIAETHAQALRYLPAAELVAIVEIDDYKRHAFARRWNVPESYRSIDHLLEAGNIDAAHVLVPPPRHFEVAEPLLKAGVPVFLEKPMAVSTAECAALQLASETALANIMVNHNFVRHAVHRELESHSRKGVIGPARQFALIYGMPLRQLAAGQLNHWMFDRPINLLLEQAVHPLSQILDLFGSIDHVEALRPPASREICGANIIRNWVISLVCGEHVGQLQLAFGQSYPVWQIILTGEDGTITGDYLRSRVAVSRPGRYPDALDRWRSTAAATAQIVGSDAKATFQYVCTQFGDKRRGDPFLASMVASADEFYRSLENSDRRTDGSGSRVVAICEALAGDLAPRTRRRIGTARRKAHEVLVVGGTGFIGRSLVRALAQRRRSVAVLARDVDAVPRLFASEQIGAFRGSVLDPSSLDAAMRGCDTVIDLASGGMGHPSELRGPIVGGAINVAERAAQRGVRHLVHLSSIAALYLGRRNEIVRGDAGVDSQLQHRADYARAKAEAEEGVRAVCRRHGLALTILRPGLVVGEARTPFHGGVGEFNRETHCLGWNRGRNPLPFVLVEDVADAIAKVVEVGSREGACFNLVGDVRLTAQEYIQELGDALGRPLRYHPRSVAGRYAMEWGKWLIKRATGRRNAAIPSYRDLASRGLVAQFDTSDVKAVLGWRPEASREAFIARTLKFHL